MLTKLNVEFLLPAVALLLLPQETFLSDLRNRSWIRIVLFGATAAAVAGSANLIRYMLEPELFVRAHRFELVNSQFEELSNPIVKLGRLGLAPELVSRSLLEMLRSGRFLIVLGTMAVSIAAATRTRVRPALWAWLLWSTGFALLQNFQPVRYFFLAAPIHCYFAALAVLFIQD